MSCTRYHVRATAQTKGSHGYRTCIWTRARVSITLIRKGAPISARHTRAKRSLRRGGAHTYIHTYTCLYTCQLWGGRTCPTCVTCHLCGMDPCHGMHRCRRSCTNPWGKAYSHACTRESKFSDLGHPYHISSETCISRSQNLSGGDRSVFSLNRTNRCAHIITRDPHPNFAEIRPDLDL